MQARATTIGDPQGLHAQLAHELCRTARSFTASIWIRHAGNRASLNHPIELLALGARAGDEVTVLADGSDETAALAAICRQIETKPVF